MRLALLSVSRESNRSRVLLTVTASLRARLCPDAPAPLGLGDEPAGCPCPSGAGGQTPTGCFDPSEQRGMAHVLFSFRANRFLTGAALLLHLDVHNLLNHREPHHLHDGSGDQHVLAHLRVGQLFGILRVHDQLEYEHDDG